MKEKWERRSAGGKVGREKGGEREGEGLRVGRREEGSGGSSGGN